MPLPILIILAFREKHVFTANRDILNTHETNYEFRPYGKTQRSQPRERKEKRTTRNIVISDPTNCVNGSRLFGLNWTCKVPSSAL